MRRLVGLVVSWLALGGAAMLWAADPPRRPNILVIYTDDHGWADLGAQGVDADVRTPQFDRLAADGVRCTHGYVSAPQCVPSRAGVLTGRYQQRFGVEDNTRGPLPLAEQTIAERLAEAGYLTGMVGKWHLDIGGAKGQARALRHLADHMPHGQGFAEYWRGESRQFYASHDLAGQPLADAPRLVADDRFRITVQTEAALGFLDRRAARPEQPWFLYLAWYAPHVPLEPPEPWFSRTPENLPQERRQALAMIAAMDEGLGRIRAKLVELGQEQETLIFVIGDNGAPVKAGAWNGSLNRPLVGEKGMLTDGGVRVPFLVAWPGTLPAGTVYDQPVSNLDVASTAVAAAGLPRAAELDGVDLRPFLAGQRTEPPHAALYWRWRSQAAALEYPWKLVRLGPERKYLFDLSSAEGETRNRLTDEPERAARLDGLLAAWAAKLSPPGLPTEVNQQDATFFVDHGVDPTLAELAAKRRPRGGAAAEPPGSVQGWIARNGTLEVRDGALVLSPAKGAGPKAKPFLACTNLNLVGPLTLRLRARGPAGGRGTLSWRTEGQQDFVPEQAATFDWPGGDAGVEAVVELPVAGRLIHVRLTPPVREAAVAIESLELRPARGEPRRWTFDGP